MKNKIKGFINKKQELIFVIVLNLILLSLIIFFTDVETIYQTNSLNTLFLSIFGTLFGLLLTSYAILFGLIPALSIDTLETHALESVNFRFFTSLIINLLIIILGLAILFLEKNISIYLIYTQLFFIIFLILMFGLLIFYLMLLFKGAKINAIKDKKRKLTQS